MKKSSSRIAGVLALLTAAVHAPVSAERFTERFAELYTVAADVEVRLVNTNGSVVVESWDRDQVEVVAEKSLDSRSRRDAEEAFEAIQIDVRESADRLEIETRQPRHSHGFMDWLLGRARNVSVRYELRVPRGAEIDLRTVNGSVRTEATEGLQRLRSTNGRIEVAAARGSVDAHTTNGSIRVEVSAVAEPLDIDLGSTNGGITLLLPPEIRASVEARTTNGSVRTDLPLTLRGAASRRRLSGELNGGGAGRIALRTMNGGIRIDRSGV